MDIYFKNTDTTPELVIEVNDDSYRYRVIKGEHNLTLHFSLTQHVEIPVGAWCMFEGERYELEMPSNFKKNNTRNFDYTLIMESVAAKAKKYKFRNPVDRRLKFNLTAKPREHLQMFIDNMNARDSGWTIGECIDAPEKLISYNHAFCIDALTQQADEFETEYEFVGKKVSLHKVEYNKANPLPLSYGKGNGFKPGIGRANYGDTKPIEVLYVQGGEENIDASKYGSKELLLPKNATLRYDGTHFEGEPGFDPTKARSYVADADGFSIRRSDKPQVTGVEDSLDCSHISPKRVGGISKVEVINAAKNFYDFIDNTIPADLNYNDCIIGGETMTVVFQSGMLAGKEFEVKYKHSEKRFEIVPQEIDGVTMPNNTFKPIAGQDTYAVFNISLPAAYVCNNETKSGASWDMFRESVKYLYENEEQKFTFTGELDGTWAKRDWLNIGGKIRLGGYILFSDTQFQPEGVAIRIVGIKDYINKPHSPEIELSNQVIGSSFISTIGKIEENEVVMEENRKEVLQFTKRRFRDALETMSMLNDAMLDNFSKSINPLTVQTMAMLVGDESLQFRFVNSKTNPTEVSHNVTYNQTTKVLNVPGGIIQHLTLGISTISSEHKAGEYKFWTLQQFNTPPLVDATKQYYLYAKVSTTEQTGSFYISEKAIKMEEVSGFYHLLMGVLNSEFDEERSYVSLYGFTEILPGRITTDRIVSSNGETYFDLSIGEIGGRIVFKSSTGKNKTLPELEAAAAEDATAKAKAAYKDAITAAAEDAKKKDESLLSYANEATDKKIAKFGSTIIDGGYLKNSMIDTDNLLVKNIYSKGGKFRTLDDGTMYAVGGIFSGYLRTPLVSLEESDAVWNSSRHVFCIKDNLNIMSDGLLDTYHSYEDWIELPFDTKYIGSRIVILNNRFPPYTRTPGSSARTVLLVSSASKDAWIGIGGKPKTGSYQESDPFAIEILGRAVELLCVPHSNSRVYWIITNWDNQIIERTWE